MSKFSEEISVASRDLKSTVEKLLNDATVDRFKIVNRKTGKTLLDVPAVIGLPTLFVFNIWSIIGAAVMYVADYTIVVERNVEPVIIEPEVTPPPYEVESVPDADLAVAEPVDEDEAAEDDPFVDLPVELGEDVSFDRCQATTKSGSQCKRSPMEGSAFCYSHQPK